jgi:hypothetical protein
VYFLLSPYILQAQVVQELSYKIEGDKIRVTYNLKGEPSERYTITLFSSANDFSSPLQYVTGDVGDDVIPGIGKTILWDARREFSEYKGSIKLTIKYKISPVQVLTKIAEGTKYKKGKTYNIKWYEGPTTLTATVDLYQNNEFIQQVTLNRSGIEWQWEVPKKLKAGKEYKFKTSINGKPAYSQEFIIRGKFYLVYIAVPLVATGIVVAIITSNSSTDDTISLPPEPN